MIVFGQELDVRLFGGSEDFNFDFSPFFVGGGTLPRFMASTDAVDALACGRAKGNQ
jgi:hypothetical protein